MIRWCIKLLCLAALGCGLYLIAFQNAPDTEFAAASNPAMLAANLPGGRAEQPEIRVLVADAVDHAVLTINGRIRMDAVTMRMDQRTGEFSQSVQVDVTPTGQGIKIGADLYVRVRMKSLDSQPLRLTWRNGDSEVSVAIPHEIEIYGTHVTDANKRRIPRVRILARLPIEEYLYGVVAGEVPTSWPLEALRAQAIASRTFAFFEIKSRRNEEYDVHAGTRSQVWRPSMAVEPQVRRAVDSTAGIVLTDHNALIKTFFHSECGGFTADARWVFTRTPVLSLSGVRCPRCSQPANKPSTWTKSYTRAEIAQRLRKAGVLRQQGQIRHIAALDANGNPLTRSRGYGRAVVMELTLTGGSGLTVRIPANDFRLAMGSDRQNIASTYMVVTDEGEHSPNVTFAGQGWGHGVGLCQYGASYAADRMGYTFLDIVALYYPGSKPVRLWSR